MSTIFVDTQYWVARFHPRDQWHERAQAVEADVAEWTLVTSEPVLVEFLNFFSAFRSSIRREAARVAAEIHESRDTEVVASSSRLFREGLHWVEQRLDKNYSMVDCMSMAIMQQRNITNVLTNDDHFAQEGFTLWMGGDR